MEEITERLTIDGVGDVLMRFSYMSKPSKPSKTKAEGFTMMRAKLLTGFLNARTAAAAASFASWNVLVLPTILLSQFGNIQAAAAELVPASATLPAWLQPLVPIVAALALWLVGLFSSSALWLRHTRNRAEATETCQVKAEDRMLRILRAEVEDANEEATAQEERADEADKLAARNWEAVQDRENTITDRENTISERDNEIDRLNAAAADMRSQVEMARHIVRTGVTERKGVVATLSRSQADIADRVGERMKAAVS